MPDRYLTTAQRRTLESLCDRIVPNAAQLGAPELTSAVEARLANGDARLAKDVALLLAVFGSRLTALVLAHRTSAFTSWTADEQDQWLKEWDASGLSFRRTVFQAVRRLILSTFYASPPVQTRIGSMGPMHTRDASLAWEGAMNGAVDDADPVKRVQPPSQARTAHRHESDAWRAANVVPRGVIQGVDHTSDSKITADVCVIGSGAGGAVVAARLAEAGLDVVVIEEGGYYTAADFTEDEGDMVPRLYADAGARATDDLSLSILQGRSVGGGTTINWMIMLRTPDAVLDEWADDHDTEGMRGADLARYYDIVERDVHARLVPDDAHAPHNRLILEGARKLGWHARPAMINARDCVRSGFCGVGCRYGAKQSTLVTYIPRALAAGARVYSDVRAERVEVIEPGVRGKKRVVGTVIDRLTGLPLRSLQIEAPRVVLAAGAVGTPAILQRSGLGGGGVGRFLRVHPTTAIVGRYAEQMYGAAGIPQSALCDEFLTSNDGYGFWLEAPALLPALASVAVPGFGSQHRKVMEEFPRLSSLISLVRDGANRTHSSGSVRVDRRGRTHIDYRVADEDRGTLIDGMTAAARLHFAAGAKEVMTLHSPALTLTNEGEVSRIAQRACGPNQLGMFTAHMNGTCRIGTDPRISGCTPDAERHGTPGLYVVDGSLFPTAPGVNPQNTIMALGHLFAERIAATARA